MRGNKVKILAPAVGALCLMVSSAEVQAAIIGDIVASYGFGSGPTSAVDDVLGVSTSSATMLDGGDDDRNTKYLADAGNPAPAIGRWTSRSAGTVGTIAQAIAGNDALGLTLTPTSASPVTFTGLSFDLVFQNLPDVAHTTTWALYGSLDGFATAPSGANKLGEWTFNSISTVPSTSNDHWISSQEVTLGEDFQNLATPVSFRIYMASTLATSANLMGIDNLVVRATPVPEPAALGLLACGAALILQDRRRARRS